MPSFWQGYFIVGMLLNIYGLSGDMADAFKRTEKQSGIRPPYSVRMVFGILTVTACIIGWPALALATLLQMIGRGK